MKRVQILANTHDDMFYDSGLGMYIQDALNAAGKLQDYYFGDPAVGHLIKCYELLEKAQAQYDLANAKLDQ